MAKRQAGTARKTGGRTVGARIHVGRTAGRSDFQACVAIGGRAYARRMITACSRASNPRKAVSAALRKAATYLDARKGGAFAGKR